MPDVWDLVGYIDQAFRELYRAALGREPGEGHEPKSGIGSGAATVDTSRAEAAPPTAKPKPKRTAQAKGRRGSDSPGKKKAARATDGAGARSSKP
jgi:hypothetical protein